MYIPFVTIFVASGLALALSSLHTPSVKSFLGIARIACIVGAVAGLALSVIAVDVAVPGKFAITFVGAASAAVTMLVVGLTRKSSITKQRETAPEVTRFLRYNFNRLAKSDASGYKRITLEALREAMQRYEGNNAKTLQQVATHFKDIGHLVDSRFVSMPMALGASSGLGSVDGYYHETYAIDLKDVDTYIERLATMYDGW